MPRLPDYRIVRWLFPRLLAAIYFIAFFSWGVQYRGLVGQEGIAPVPRLIQSVEAYEQREGKSLLLEYPTLLRFDSSDLFALGLIGACCFIALLVMAGVAQRWLLLALWLGYLSLMVTGDVFSNFQWDALLLEAGLLAVWLAPGKVWTGRHIAPPPRGSVFLLHWLTFRLMFLAGLVKIGGGDPVWRDMSAMLYHYFTQPLPNGLSWWAHHLPRGVHEFSCWVMHATELVLPVAIFLGRWGRLIAALGFIALMATVFATGNYTFFNLLSAALAVTLLDDSWWPQKLKARLLPIPAAAPPESHPKPVVAPGRIWLRRSANGIAVAAVLLLTLLATDSFLVSRVRGYQRQLPVWAHEKIYQPLAGLRSFNAYGLFQDMTVERPEVIIEASDDGILWLPLEFKWKPGDPKVAPSQVAPHQPRLDWQMWFAALTAPYVPERDQYPGAPLYWFGEFMGALLHQKQPVWDLLAPPPFPQQDVRFLRAQLYQYRFSTPEERNTTGQWWVRQHVGSFSPGFSLNSAR